MNLANFKIVTPIVLFSSSASAGISSKCLDQINLALNNGSDSAPIPVECQYYKISDLEKSVQTKIIEHLKKSKDTVTKDSKLSSVLGSLRNSNISEVTANETKGNDVIVPKAESLILTNSTSEETKTETNTSTSCVPDSTIDLSTAPRTPIEEECKEIPSEVISGKVYFADDVGLSRVLTLAQDKRWCCVDKNRKAIDCEKIMDGIRKIPDGVGTNQDELGKDGPWTPEKSGNMLTDKACRAGKYSFKTSIKSVNLEVLNRLKYFVPAKDWKNKK